MGIHMREDIYRSFWVDLARVGETEGLMVKIRLACHFHDKISISGLIVQGARQAGPENGLRRLR
jgi:hypothetical protein